MKVPMIALLLSLLSAANSMPVPDEYYPGADCPPGNNPQPRAVKGITPLDGTPPQRNKILLQLVSDVSNFFTF